MSVCWIFLVLLGFSSSHATKCLSTCACNDQVKIACVSNSERVSVPCPFSDAQEVGFSLYRDKEKIDIYTHYNQNNSMQTEKSIHIKAGMDLHVNNINRSVNFLILAASSGSYSCETKNIFPPPIRSVHNESKILVLMQGHECNCSADSNLPRGDIITHEPPLWIWILGFAAVSVYSVIVTIIACVNWLKLRTSESNSDYMNTKPRAPKGHRKRGVQHPVPRHF